MKYVHIFTYLHVYINQRKWLAKTTTELCPAKNESCLEFQKYGMTVTVSNHFQMVIMSSHSMELKFLSPEAAGTDPGLFQVGAPSSRCKLLFKNMTYWEYFGILSDKTWISRGGKIFVFFYGIQVFVYVLFFKIIIFQCDSKQAKYTCQLISDWM